MEKLKIKLAEVVKSKRPGLKIRVQRAGCLDQCERGIAAVVYPHSIWFENVSPDQVDQMADQILTHLE